MTSMRFIYAGLKSSPTASSCQRLEMAYAFFAAPTLLQRFRFSPSPLFFHYAPILARINILPEQFPPPSLSRPRRRRAAALQILCR